jgi:hypothetical protein
MFAYISERITPVYMQLMTYRYRSGLNLGQIVLFIHLVSCFSLGLQNSSNFLRRFPAYSILIPGIFHPGALKNLGILEKLLEFLNPKVRNMFY